METEIMIIIIGFMLVILIAIVPHFITRELFNKKRREK